MDVRCLSLQDVEHVLAAGCCEIHPFQNLKVLSANVGCDIHRTWKVRLSNGKGPFNVIVNVISMKQIALTFDARYLLSS